MKIAALVLALLLIAVLARGHFFGFRAQSPEDYADTGPAFVPQEHLSGPIVAEGVIFGPTGRVASRFDATMEGVWDGNSGTLTEDFTFSTGNRQQRAWQITLGDDGTVTATASDVIGEAKGKLSGATLSLRYRIRLSEAAGGHVLDVADWMYLTPGGTVVNRSEMRKFGVLVGELVATLRPAGAKAVAPEEQ